MVELVNTTGIIGSIINNASTTTTGSLFITLLIIVAVILLFFMMFGVSLEWSALFIAPLLIAMAAYVNMGIPLGVLLIYLTFLMARTFFIR